MSYSVFSWILLSNFIDYYKTLIVPKFQLVLLEAVFQYIYPQNFICRKPVSIRVLVDLAREYYYVKSIRRKGVHVSILVFVDLDLESIIIMFFNHLYTFQSLFSWILLAIVL